jgi:DNA-binding transcriptional regulator GbsR (MarR family)
MFIGFFKLIGLQKSIGEIYGLLFVSPRALSMEEIVERLGISLGAASQGLKVLRGVGAVKTVYMPGDRRDHFLADLELSRFATAFIKEELQPRLDRALERIDAMESLADDLPTSERRAAEERLERLKHWLERGEKMLPWILRFLVK